MIHADEIDFREDCGADECGGEVLRTGSVVSMWCVMSYLLGYF